MPDSPYDETDAAIDRAVREIMSVEPRTDMRQRVLARLNDRPARTLTLPRLAMASAMAGIAIVILILSSRPGERAAPPTVVKGPAPAAQPRDMPPAREVVRDDPEKKPRLVTPDVRQPETARVHAASLDEKEHEPLELTVDVEPLESIDPIQIAPVQTPVVATTEVTVKPLTMENIAIAPLPPPQ
jgi:hypothetical protein